VRQERGVLYLNLTVIIEKAKCLVLHKYMLLNGAVGMHIQSHNQDNNAHNHALHKSGFPLQRFLEISFWVLPSSHRAWF
jgi:hypothetical protein